MAPLLLLLRIGTLLVLWLNIGQSFQLPVRSRGLVDTCVINNGHRLAPSAIQQQRQLLIQFATPDQEDPPSNATVSVPSNSTVSVGKNTTDLPTTPPAPQKAVANKPPSPPATPELSSDERLDCVAAAVTGTITGTLIGTAVAGQVSDAPETTLAIVGLSAVATTGGAFFASTKVSLVRTVLGKPTRAVGSAISGLVQLAVENFVASVKAIPKTIQTAAKNQVDKTISGIQQLPNTIQGKVKEAAESAKRAAKQKAENTVTEIKSLPQKAAQSVQDTVEDITDEIKQIPEKARERAQQTAEEIAQEIQQTPARVSKAAEQAATNLAEEISQTPEKVKQSAMTKLQDTKDRLTGGATSQPKPPTIPPPPENTNTRNRLTQLPKIPGLDRSPPQQPKSVPSDQSAELSKAPKIELPKVEIPRVDLPKIDVPKVELPKIDLPKPPQPNSAASKAAEARPKAAAQQKKMAAETQAKKAAEEKRVAKQKRASEAKRVAEQQAKARAAEAKRAAQLQAQKKAEAAAEKATKARAAQQKRDEENRKRQEVAAQRAAEAESKKRAALQAAEQKKAEAAAKAAAALEAKQKRAQQQQDKKRAASQLQNAPFGSIRIIPPAAKSTQRAPRGVPTIVGWKKRRDGGISGRIYGSPNFDDGDRIETSVLKDNSVTANGMVVVTESGSRYFLSDEKPLGATKTDDASIKTLLSSLPGATIQLTKKAKQLDESSKPVAVAPSRPTFSLFGLSGTSKEVEDPLPPAKASKPTKKAPRGVPTMKRWKKNRDGTLSGMIFGSPNFSDGERVTTSKLTSSENKSGDIVRTISGSRYFLE